MKNINKLAELIVSSQGRKALSERLDHSISEYRNQHAGYKYLEIKSLDSAEHCLQEIKQHLNDPYSTLEHLNDFFQGPGNWGDDSVKTSLINAIAEGDAAEYFNKNRTPYSFNKPRCDKGHARNHYFEKTIEYAENYVSKNVSES